MKYINGFLLPEVGDKVLVRKDLCRKTYLNYNGEKDSAVEGMLKYAGKYVTIEAITWNHKFLTKETFGWNWTTEMFDLSECMIPISSESLVEFLGE